MKVSKLIGPDLDYWVAKAEDLDVRWSDEFGWWYSDNGSKTFNPSTNWSQGGPLQEKYDIWISSDDDGKWICSAPPHVQATLGDENPYLFQEAETSLIAICRCVVVSVYGEEIEMIDKAN